MTGTNTTFFLIVGTLTFSLLIVFIVYFVLLYRKMQMSMLLEQEKMRQALLKAEIEVREQTLMQVSQELHDNLGQLTSLISINLKMLDLSNCERDKARISEIQGLVSQLTHDIKNLSYSLNGERVNQFGWSPLIEREVERMNRSGLVSINYSLTPSLISKVSTDKALTLFRIIQELFNNTLRHSKATICTLHLDEKKQQLHLQYTDNGQGFDPRQVSSSSNGHYSIKKRCHDISATITIDSQPGNGILVDIYMPLTKL
ncbi:MAG: histidine kinase [Schleiferiaceae bacterium]|nr:histidine kinase [Schleiferiaceae bacterium]